MDVLYRTMRYAFTGVTVAVAVDTLADFAGMTVIKVFDTVIPPTTTAAKTGRDIFRLTVSIAVAATGLLAGENILTRLNPGEEDPLYRWFFYQAAFAASSLAMNTVITLQRTMRSFLASITTVGSSTKLGPGIVGPSKNLETPRYEGPGPQRPPNLQGPGPEMPPNLPYGQNPPPGMMHPPAAPGSSKTSCACEK